MDTGSCILQWPSGRPGRSNVPPRGELALVSRAHPRLEWTARVRGLDPVKLVDVAGQHAFRAAGLYAFAKCSPEVRLFVFDPNADHPGCFRYECWLTRAHDVLVVRQLHMPLVPNAWVESGDAVEAMIAAERDCKAALLALAGSLL